MEKFFGRGGIEALGIRDADHLLKGLIPRNFVVRYPESTFDGEREWGFYHHLLHTVTYESLLRRERTRLHHSAGKWLETQARGADRLDEFAGLLAEHAEKAGDYSRAADYYLQAGAHAIMQGASPEAVAHFQRSLELLPPIEGEKRWQALINLVDLILSVSQSSGVITTFNEVIG